VLRLGRPGLGLEVEVGGMILDRDREEGEAGVKARMAATAPRIVTVGEEGIQLATAAAAMAVATAAAVAMEDPKTLAWWRR
jgi:hypothetical protein